MVTTVQTDHSVDDEPSKKPASGQKRSPSPKSRMKAVAEKIGAARELARRLAEEKQAAMKTGMEYNEGVLKSTEAAAMEAAIQAAEADSMNRALRSAELGKQKDAEVRQLKKLTKALKGLVLEMASDRNEAEKRLNALLAEKEEEAEAILEEMDMEPVLIMEEPVAEISPPPMIVSEEVEKMEKEVDSLKKAAEIALKDQQVFFTVPMQPVAGRPIKFVYNRLAGPLPESASLFLKYGLNKWEEMAQIKMEKSENLTGVDGEWWEVDFMLEELLYQFDFVVVDEVSGLVDNNASKDFRLSFQGGLTKKELMEKRLEMFEKNEEHRNQQLDAEITNLREEAMKKAQNAAEAARMLAERKWDDTLSLEAKSSISDQRSEALRTLNHAENTHRTNQVAWCGPLTPGSVALLAYNTAHGPLKDCKLVRVHLGVDNWYKEEITIIELHPLSPEELKKHKIVEECGKGVWLGAKLRVPKAAAVFNFVFDDGKSVVWDNHEGKDYLTSIIDPLSDADLIAAKIDQLRETRAKEISRSNKGAESKAGDRIMAKLDSGIRRWKSQWQYLYTNPTRLEAGAEIELCYRPDLTVLRGRPDVFVKVGFNHWKHPNQVPFTRLEPMIAAGIGFQKATIRIPEDAYCIDFHFSDSSDQHGGFIDNNSGLDYHLPVSGSEINSPSLKITHVTVEMAPIAKVGGLADVVTALGRAVQDEGHQVEVIIPKYDCIDYEQVTELKLERNFDHAGTNIQVWKGIVEGLEVTFLEPENGFFWVGCIYGRSDDADRFQFFCTAASEYLRLFNVSPDVVHCHDWQTAPVIWSDLAGAKSLFTIHNLNYGVDLIGKAMESTSLATTVSPTYATEISGSPAIESNLHKLFGVLNGIDVEIWSPAHDTLLPVNYSSEDVIQGKAVVRHELRKRLSLAQIDVPLVGVVTRLTPQKGIHLIKHAAWRTLERGGQFVLLGSAPDPRIQHEFDRLADDLKRQYPDRAALLFAYDEPLSHLIYAGCDLFLVPSMFEPCGLTQMIAMRYGTVPLVRKTGGLNDTVFDVDTDEERAADRGMETNGFNFDGADEVGMDYALNRALGFFFNDRDAWNALCKRVMEQDWSWSLPALDYLQLYYKVQG